MHHFTHPTFVVDISHVYDSKLELLKIHDSQFSKTAEDFGLIPLGVSDYLFGLESRDRFFGSLIGVHHGEALVSDTPVKLATATQILSIFT
ncbi:MAG: hypothetical protein JOY54_09125 [Acidobacteriaceae bacterium]|nr:hypothetical protein [Acidobacteriaceae bacterium]